MADLMMTCPHCGEGVKLPATVTESNHETGRVVLQLAGDQAGGLAHLAECRRKPAALAPTVSEADLRGRIHRMLDLRAYVVTGGSRACTLCGKTGGQCMAQVAETRTPCCAGCGNGNTHPAPGEAKGSCAEWAEAHQAGGQ